MSRGNRKGSIFDDDNDRKLFLATLEKTAERYEIRCYAYCLMGNHYHLVLDTPRGNLADAMRYLNGVFTQGTNRRHQRTGHLYEGRYRSLVIERDGYLRRSSRYVVLNPVRSGIVRGPAAWRWSSYRATAGLEPPPPFLYTGWIEAAFDATSPKDAYRKYQQFVNDPIERKNRPAVHLVGLGPLAFERVLREALKADTADRPLPRACRSLARPTLEIIFGTASSKAARDERICKAHVVYGYRLSEIAAFLGLDPSTPSVILRRADARIRANGL